MMNGNNKNNNYNNNTRSRCDDWVFSLVVKNNVTIINGNEEEKLSSSSSQTKEQKEIRRRKSAKRIVVELRSNNSPQQQQPSSSNNATTPTNTSAAATAAVAASQSKQQQQQQQHLLLSTSLLSPTKTDPLLDPLQQQQHASSAGGTGAYRDGNGVVGENGWNFHGPNWSLKSIILLKIIYRPSYQALPEYTNISASYDNMMKGMKTLFTCSTGTSNNTSSTNSYKKIDYIQEIYTTNDIYKIKDNFTINIRGIGLCRAIQLYVKQHQKSNLASSIPIKYKSALQKQWNIPTKSINNIDFMNNNRFIENNDTLPIPPWEEQNEEEESYATADNDDDDEEEQQQQHPIIITFAMPISKKSSISDNNQQQTTGPPLLWKVQIPPNKYIAIETYTVLSGKLTTSDYYDYDYNNNNKYYYGNNNNNTNRSSASTSSGDESNNSSNNNNDDESRPLYNKINKNTHHNNNDSSFSSSSYCPTHVYINGYQSWSFTGNITKGDPQPQPALPFMFSGAFNNGGSLPPDEDYDIIETITSKSSSSASSTAKEGRDFDDDNNDDDYDNNSCWDDEDVQRPKKEQQSTRRRRRRRQRRRRRRRPLRQGICCDNNLYNGYKSDFFACITSDGGGRIHNNKNKNKSDRLLDESGGPALVLGFLSQHHHFGIIQIDNDLEHIDMYSSAQGQIIKNGNETDWCYAQLATPHSCYDEEPMVHYLHAVASYNEAKPLQNGSLLTGWCSWYHYYEDISQRNLRDNFEKLHSLRNKVPTNVSIVDDGYMTAWGDWSSLKPKKFPVSVPVPPSSSSYDDNRAGTTATSKSSSSNGLNIVSRDIRHFGMRPGLWLAPFACDKFSKLAKGHGDWIIRNNEGRYANSSNCGKFFYGLDATNPNVREYVSTCIGRAVKEYEFDVLKIDFLYAACLAGNGRYDLSISRAEAMHLALHTIRSAAGPDTFLIGCGCPIGTAIGYVDGMRISADTGPTWYPSFPLPWWDHGGTLPCLRTMVRNSVTRAPFGHRWWHNDPDCLLLGESTSLTDLEVSSAASVIAMTCGMLLLSDDLTKVSLSRMRILTKIYPMTGATAVPLDLHSCNDAIPSMLRLWCTDRYDLAPYKSDDDDDDDGDSGDPYNREATFFGRQASFAIDKDLPHPNERKRNCIHVAKGLGTWTLLSLSNWLDEPSVVHAPSEALHPPPETGWEDDVDLTPAEQQKHNKFKAAKYGYHVFAFWSSTCIWMSDHDANDINGGGKTDVVAGTTTTTTTTTNTIDNLNSNKLGARTLSRRLNSHETEIFHIKPVSSELPQYIGSDIHFSCGYEVKSFSATTCDVRVCLKNSCNRVGSVFVYIPRPNVDNMTVLVSGTKVNRKVGGWDIVCSVPHENTAGREICIGRVIRVWIVVHGDKSANDGEVSIQF